MRFKVPLSFYVARRKHNVSDIEFNTKISKFQMTIVKLPKNMSLFCYFSFESLSSKFTQVSKFEINVFEKNNNSFMMPI